VVSQRAKSKWLPVVSGVPQGFVLGPLVFIIFVGVMSNILRFADGTKIFNKIASPEDVLQLQQDLRNLYQWSVDWCMLFNPDKYVCLHFGFQNADISRIQ